MHFGKDEGLNYDILDQSKKDYIDSWDYNPEGGENWHKLKERMINFFNENYVENSLNVCFTHGGSICTLTYDLGIEDIIPPSSVVGIDIFKQSNNDSIKCLNFDIQFVWQHPEIDLSKS